MKKLNLLFVMIDGGGNVPPVFGLIKQLKKRGHNINVLAEPCLEEAVIKLECNFIPFTEYFLKEDRQEDFFKDHAATMINNPIFERVIFGPAETVVDQCIQTAKSLNIDMLLIDLLLFPAVMAGEFLNIPKILLFHMPEYLPGPNRPPGNMGIRPGSGFFTRMRDKMLSKIFNLKFNSFKPTLNKIRHKLDLAPIKNTADLIHGADLRIIQTLRSFDIPIEPAPKNVRYSGPILDDPDWAQSKELGFILDKKPLVVIAFSSTFQNQVEVIQNSINALKYLPVQGLVTLGMAMEKQSFEVPENISIVNSIQHSMVFPHASLVITHAGHGTVIRALANGLPLICLPNGRDQKDNALKVEMKGCGIMLSRKSSSKKIKKSVERILKDGKFKRAAKQLKQEILAHEGMEEILVEIENL